MILAPTGRRIKPNTGDAGFGTSCPRATGRVPSLESLARTATWSEGFFIPADYGRLGRERATYRMN